MLKQKYKAKKIISIAVALAFITISSTYSQTVTIDVRWDTFNKNQYDGALLMPVAADGSVEFVGGFGKSTSKDGTVITGDKEGTGLSGIGSLNSMHWEIKQFKNGFYIEPTILEGHNKMRVFQEEIFCRRRYSR